MSTSYDDDAINDRGLEDTHERLMDSTATNSESSDIETNSQTDKQAEPVLSAHAGDDLSHLKRIRNPNQLRATPNETITSPFLGVVP